MGKDRQEEGAELLLDFDKRDGLLPVVVQEVASGDILMVASVSQEAFDETVKSGIATFYSTSRQELWKKGETSGDFLRVEEILTDCDQDALVYRVTIMGAGACHTKDEVSGTARKSCFYRRLNRDGDSLVPINH